MFTIFRDSITFTERGRVVTSTTCSPLAWVLYRDLGTIARDMVLVTKPMFFDMGNHLRPLSEASDRPEGQELGGGAVGGQEVLQEVKL